jgi:8-amino-7-oxononanoate synthase
MSVSERLIQSQEREMSLFAKCHEFSGMIEKMKSRQQFFYLREFDPCNTARVSRHGKPMVMLGSNNYLGLANHPKVIEAAVKAIREHGTGACSSRLLTGTTSLHTRLEKKLAEFKGSEDAVVFSTGFMTMMGTVSALATEGDTIISDELNHASIVEGCRLSKARVKVYPHQDMSGLRNRLKECKGTGNVLIVTDGVFSMKGSVANLPEIKRLADDFGASVMVDDAHGTGVLGATGRGTLEHFGLEGQIDLVCGTFSKSLGTVGGFTCATREIVSFLRLNARSFIFTASPPPAVVATALASLEVLESEPELLARLRTNTAIMKQGLQTLGFEIEDSITPIIPIQIGDEEITFQMAGLLEDEGVIVNPIVSPAVPREASLIRASMIASLTREDIEFALDRFAAVGKRVGLI